MGLLDNFDDPMTQGLLSAGFTGLAASGPSFRPIGAGQVFGTAGNAGIEQMNAQQILKMKREENQIKRDALLQRQAMEYGTTPFIDANGRALLVGKDGSMVDTGVKAPIPGSITPSQQAELDIKKVPMGYRMTTGGTLEAIPGGPADAKALNQIAGKNSLSETLADLRLNYEALQKGGGIVDPNATAPTNMLAGISSSGVGQAVGNLVGTENQSTRNKINMTRPLLLQAIKNATGMSAKQMDSNAELKLWLATATDPSKDIAANLDAIDRIEKTYGGTSEQTGQGLQPKPTMTPLDQEAVTWAKANILNPQMKDKAKAILLKNGIQ